MTQVPFAAPARETPAIRDAAVAAFTAILDSGSFVGGPAVARFESHFAEFCGVGHCVSVGSGTAALHLALLAAGVGPGSRVITAPTTFIATAEAIRYTGAEIEFVDVDPATGILDAEALAPLGLGPGDAVVPVHLYGQMADMGRLRAICGGNGISLIEDACQAHGATHDGRPAGSLSDAGCFSFYPTKNLGAAGEGGAIVTDDGDLAEECRKRRDHGQERKYVHQLLGFNYRLDAIQAEVLDLKLSALDARNARRREVAAAYSREMADLPLLRLPPEIPGNVPVFHLYVVRHPRRDAVAAGLAELGIQTAIHYPIPVHLQPAFEDLGYKRGDFPVAEAFSDEILSLPMFPGLTDEEVDAVVSAVREVCERVAEA